MGAFKTIELTHQDDITEIRFHTDGGPLRVERNRALRGAYDAFPRSAPSRETKVVIDHRHWRRVVQRRSTRPASGPLAG